MHDGWHDAYCADAEEVTWIGQALLVGLTLGAAGWCVAGVIVYRAWRIIR